MALPGMVFHGFASGTALVPMACSPGRLRALQREVETWCRDASSCNGVTDCQTLLNNMAVNQWCYMARDTMNRECFDGGDEGHRQAAQDALNARYTCSNRFTNRACDPTMTTTV